MSIAVTGARRESRTPPRILTALLSLLLAAGVSALTGVGAAHAASYALQVSTSPDRSAAAGLDGRTLSGDVYIFVGPDAGLRTVAFYLDDPQRAKAPTHTENTVPMDLAGGSASTANPFATSALSTGSHTLTAAVTDTSGSTTVLSATFTVSGAQPAASPYTLQVSTSPERSAPAGLDGRTVSGSVYVFVGPDAGLSRVDFYLDDPQRTKAPTHTENTVPMDFAGGAPAAPNPFDTSSLSTGSHTMTAVVTDSSGVTLVLNATFTVAGTSTPPPAPSLFSSTAPDRSAPHPLAGATETGKVYIFIAPDAGLNTVDFYLDNPQHSGTPTHSEGYAPMDFAGGSVSAAAPFDTSTLTPGNHTITAVTTGSAGTDVVNATFSVAGAGTPPPTGTPAAAVSSPDDAVLNLPGHRLVFSTYSSRATPARSLTFTNSGDAPLTITGLAVAGADASSFSLGQTALTVAPGAKASLPVTFTPTAATGCPTSSAPNAVADVERYATLTWKTNAPNAATGSLDLAGLNACGVEGSNEPVLAQMFRALGYSSVVTPGSTDGRFLGNKRTPLSGDEVISPYFVAADAATPVSLVPLAHYGGKAITSSGFGATGWYLQGAPVKTPCTSAAGCRELWRFASDTSSGYTNNQKLFPLDLSSTSTTFSPTGAFGLWQGDYSTINFADDALNVALTPSNAPITPAHYLHSLRVFQAYGPGHTAIPNTYLVGVDIARVPSYKNNDYQDVVFLLKNAKPAVATGPQPGASSLTRALGASNPPAPSCTAAGFDGALPNSVGDQCDPSKIAVTTDGLALTSTPGQLAPAGGAQQNALYNVFDASRKAFTVTARIKGPVNYLSTDYQQAAVWFGPDQDNYVKVEIEHGGSTPPRAVMYLEEGGTTSILGEVPLTAATSAGTLDLIIKGDTSVPDPTPAGSDPNKVRNYPLDELTAYYSLDGAAPVQLGPVERPADVMRWFSTSAKAGVLVSGAGNGPAFTTTFTRFSIS